MTKPTDAMRAECERALDAWTQGYDPPLPGHGPSIVPGKCQRCDDFRAGFNVLAPEVRALREALEAAARSLEALSRCGTASNMDVRGYASSRARVARAALANCPEET